jgi:hypothetical protein
LDAAAQLPDCVLGELPFDLDDVLLRDAEAGVSQLEGQLSVVGDHEEPFGGDVQAPDREHSGRFGQQVEHRLAPLGVRRAADDADWLVEQVIGEPFADRQRYPVHLDVVVRAVRPLA